MLVALGADWHEEGHVAVLAVELLLLGVDRHSGPRQAHRALPAGEAGLLVVELVPGLHGPVGDGLGADGAGHGGHDEGVILRLETGLLLCCRQSANCCVPVQGRDKRYKDNTFHKRLYCIQTEAGIQSITEEVMMGSEILPCRMLAPVCRSLM